MTETGIRIVHETISCKCGGIIGGYDGKHWSCNKCNKIYKWPELEFDNTVIDVRSGIQFPLKTKEVTAPVYGVTAKYKTIDEFIEARCGNLGGI